MVCLLQKGAKCKPENTLGALLSSSLTPHFSSFMSVDDVFSLSLVTQLPPTPPSTDIHSTELKQLQQVSQSFSITIPIDISQTFAYKQTFLSLTSFQACVSLPTTITHTEKLWDLREEHISNSKEAGHFKDI